MQQYPSSREMIMPSHRPGALMRLDAASIGAVWIASVALFATPGVAQDKQPRTEVAPFHHGLHAAPAAGPTAYDEASPPLFGNLGQHTWAIKSSKMLSEEVCPRKTNSRFPGNLRTTCPADGTKAR